MLKYEIQKENDRLKERIMELEDKISYMAKTINNLLAEIGQIKNE